DTVSCIDPFYFLFSRHSRLRLDKEDRIATTYEEITSKWIGDMSLRQEWMEFRKQHNISNIVTDAFADVCSLSSNYFDANVNADVDADADVAGSPPPPLHDMSLFGLPNSKEYALHFLQLTYPYHSKIICDRCRQSRRSYILVAFLFVFFLSIYGIRYKCTYCNDFDLCEDCEEMVHLESIGMPTSLAVKYMECQRRHKRKNTPLPSSILIDCCYAECPFRQLTANEIIEHISTIHHDDPRVVWCPICEVNGHQYRNLKKKKKKKKGGHYYYYFFFLIFLKREGNQIRFMYIYTYMYNFLFCCKEEHDSDHDPTTHVMIKLPNDVLKQHDKEEIELPQVEVDHSSDGPLLEYYINALANTDSKEDQAEFECLPLDQWYRQHVVHQGFLCHGCGMQPIRGVRFSCLNCTTNNGSLGYFYLYANGTTYTRIAKNGFHLCSECEHKHSQGMEEKDLSLLLHDPRHVFVQIRKPIRNVVIFYEDEEEEEEKGERKEDPEVQSRRLADSSSHDQSDDLKQLERTPMDVDLSIATRLEAEEKENQKEKEEKEEKEERGDEEQSNLRVPRLKATKVPAHEFKFEHRKLMFAPLVSVTPAFDYRSEWFYLTLCTIYYSLAPIMMRYMFLCKEMQSQSQSLHGRRADDENLRRVFTNNGKRRIGYEVELWNPTLINNQVVCVEREASAEKAKAKRESKKSKGKRKRKENRNKNDNNNNNNDNNNNNNNDNNNEELDLKELPEELPETLASLPEFMLSFLGQYTAFVLTHEELLRKKHTSSKQMDPSAIIELFVMLFRQPSFIKNPHMLAQLLENFCEWTTMHDDVHVSFLRNWLQCMPMQRYMIGSLLNLFVMADARASLKVVKLSVRNNVCRLLLLFLDKDRLEDTCYHQSSDMMLQYLLQDPLACRARMAFVSHLMDDLTCLFDEAFSLFFSMLDYFQHYMRLGEINRRNQHFKLFLYQQLLNDDYKYNTLVTLILVLLQLLELVCSLPFFQSHCLFKVEILKQFAPFLVFYINKIFQSIQVLHNLMAGNVSSNFIS
ncbi:hypothetical protein RFI_13303, partial [Reticulomyxa filosa]